MRLLNSKKRKLEDFADDKLPKYAILSHTWEDNEVLFGDILRDIDILRDDEVDKNGRTGKIRDSCRKAEEDGFAYIWIDTCCIDKSSSAELSEAINSMYSWYRRAKRCYAYLADVPADVDVQSTNSAFAQSRWFTRGWTLQELIAPEDVVFYSRDWVKLGEKSSLNEAISKITGIDVGVLTGVPDLEFISVAKKMSWASKRKTTRVEDRAYCLMGLFHVNMPMLYGEGDKSFLRLQEEIMKESDDQSLFAWMDTESPQTHRGLLAGSPADFANSGGVVRYGESEHLTPFYTTNRGLCISLGLTHFENDVYIAALNCPVPRTEDEFIGICLKRLSTTTHQYARVYPYKLVPIKKRGNLQTIYVRQRLHLPASESHDTSPNYVFKLRKGPSRSQGYELINTVAAPSSFVSPLEVSSRAPQWIPAGVAFNFRFPPKGCCLAVALVFEYKEGTALVVMLGSSWESGVGVSAAIMPKDLSFTDFEGSFSPQVPGGYLVLEEQLVRVDVESQIRVGVKEYLVDIDIELNQTPKYLSRVDVISSQIVNEITQPISSKLSRFNFLSPKTKYKKNGKNQDQ